MLNPIKRFLTPPVFAGDAEKTRWAGLGLAIARGIIQAHGKKIWVESQGCDEITHPGSRFHVLLPITRPGA